MFSSNQRCGNGACAAGLAPETALCVLAAPQVLEAQMKVDMAHKEMLESGQSKSEEELREKCGMISDQRAVGTGRPCHARSVG